MQKKGKKQLYRPLKVTFFAIMVLCCSLLLLYWLKSMLGWDLSRSHRLSDSFPFNLFQRSKLLEPQKEGIIIDENFDSLPLENIWFLWTREVNTVRFSRNIDQGDSSKSLAFFSDTNDEWSYAFTKFIKVKQNDIYRFSGFAKKFNRENMISLRIASFDAAQTPLNWKYHEKIADSTGHWTPLSDEFVIREPEISYIKFQLVGKGKGEFRFDDIFFTLELSGR
ncbi:MAG: hypothetical protein OEV64_04680 [Desulfobulbaceae bacterium]|nr:hypothetical protein [Desulfobulbaceae bacterium]